jgi:hypothetical protein
MFRLSEIKKPIILLTILTILIIPGLVIAGGHGGMGGMSGGMHGGMSGGYYSGYYPTTSASWFGRPTPYATTIGSPYSAYGYSPYNTASFLTSPLGGYGLGGYGLGGYSGLGGYGLGGYGLGGGLYGNGIVTGKTYGTEQTYTTYVPGGEIGTTVSEYTDVAYPFGYGGYGLGGYGINPYSYGLGAGWI